MLLKLTNEGQTMSRSLPEKPGAGTVSCKLDHQGVHQGHSWHHLTADCCSGTVQAGAAEAGHLHAEGPLQAAVCLLAEAVLP